jgi:hypothetical protein
MQSPPTVRFADGPPVNGGAKNSFLHRVRGPCPAKPERRRRTEGETSI